MAPPNSSSPQHEPSYGLARRILKVIVEADASRSPVTRICALLAILSVLVGFGVAGYGLGAFVSQWL